MNPSHKYPLVRFCDLPLGARFMYPRGKREFVVLEHGGRGKVADVDHGPRTPMQGIYSFGSESDQGQLVVRTDVAQEPATPAVRSFEQQAEENFNLTLKAQDLGFSGVNEALNELDRRMRIAKPASRENGWRASHYIEPNSGKVKMILMAPTGASVNLTYENIGQDSNANHVITKFTHDFCGIPDAGFANVNDFTAFLRGLVEYDAAGLPTANQWEFGNIAADAVDAQFSGKPADWMRKLVFQEMCERLALPDGDEARIGPEETLRELNAVDRGTTRRDPAVWLTSEGKAFGRVSDEQIETVLLNALADVRERSGLPAHDPEPIKPTEDEALVMEALDFGQFSHDMLCPVLHGGVARGIPASVQAALARVLSARYVVLYGGPHKILPPSDTVDAEFPVPRAYSAEALAERIMQRAAEIAPPDSPNTDLRMGLKSIVQAIIEERRGEMK